MSQEVGKLRCRIAQVAMYLIKLSHERALKLVFSPAYFFFLFLFCCCLVSSYLPYRYKWLHNFLQIASRCWIYKLNWWNISDYIITRHEYFLSLISRVVTVSIRWNIICHYWEMGFKNIWTEEVLYWTH